MPVNDLWQDVPDEPGYWWGADVHQDGQFVLAKVFPQPGRMDMPLRIGIAGERRDYAVGHFKDYYVWQRAIPPIYFWPSPDLDP